MPRPALLAAGLCLLLGACAATPPRGEAERVFVAQQKAAARAARQQGDPARALALWRSVATLQPGDTETREAIDRLLEDIGRANTQAQAQARAAYARGDHQRGDAWMRRSLALQPGDPKALRALRESFTLRAEARQAAKSREEYAARERANGSGAAAPPGPAPSDRGELPAGSGPAPRHGRDPVLASLAAADRARGEGERELELHHLLAAAELQPPDTAELEARIKQVRREISQHWYRQGTALLQGDLPAAIDALEKSLVYDPDHRAARLKLEQARALRANLRRIRQGQ